MAGFRVSEGVVVFGAVLFYLVAGVSYSVGYTVDHSVDVTALVHVGGNMSGDYPGLYVYPRSDGYDGVFYYLLSKSPLDLTLLKDNGMGSQADRQQRILYPVVVYALSFGVPRLIPYAMYLVNLLCVALSVHVAWKLFSRNDANPLYSAYVALGAGIFYSVLLDLAEPLWALLILSGFYMLGSGRKVHAFVLFGLALFAKETALFIVVPVVLYYAMRREYGTAALCCLCIVPFALWQAVLWREFGFVPAVASMGLSTDVLWAFRLVASFLSSPSLDKLPVFVFMGVAVLSVFVSYAAVRKGMSAVSFVLAGNSLILMYSLTKPLVWGSPFGSSRIMLPLTLASFVYFAESKDRKALWIILPQAFTTLLLFAYYLTKAAAVI